ncbi:MAG: oxidoreductase, partial [Proteobacteria bacterium]|nr:oxidoreductase [Pseudomonadota bacterium]
MNGSVLAVEVRANFYLDSVALMRIAREVSALPEVVEAALMIGTAANKTLLRDAGLFDEAGDRAGPNDLILSIKAASDAAIADARRLAFDLLDQPRAVDAQGSAWRPKSLDSAVKQLVGANFALISVPGEFALAEAHKALDRGLHVMLFSDNVDLGDEIELKQKGLDRGLLVMGPDCGTALIGGMGLGFANAVPRGPIGVVSASGTGLQEVSSLVARHGGGISHGLGVGGRDLSREVGGRMTLAAIAALARDPATEKIIVISKPPDAGTAELMLGGVERARVPTIVCLIGAEPMAMPSNATQVGTLAEAAFAALARGDELDLAARRTTPDSTSERRLIGLFCGGTLCAEAQVVARMSGLSIASNTPIGGNPRWQRENDAGHVFLDLGADEFTLGRPHPMIEPSGRTERLIEALTDPATGVVLIDIVLGYGAHPDPAGELAAAIGAIENHPPIVASICGTEGDPQNYHRQL